MRSYWTRDDLSVKELESIFGTEYLQRMLREWSVSDFKARVTGYWTANEPEYYAAFRTLVRMKEAQQ